MSIILTALREARSMIETERAAFVDYHTLRNRGLEPDDQAIRQEYDDMLAKLHAALVAADHDAVRVMQTAVEKGHNYALVVDRLK